MQNNTIKRIKKDRIDILKNIIERTKRNGKNIITKTKIK